MSNGTGPDIPLPPTSVGLFSHTGGRSATLFYTAIFMPVFSLPIVILRFWTSRRLVNRWHADDTLIAISAVLGILQSVVICIQSRLGDGDHIYNISIEGLDLILKVVRWAGVPLYNLTTIFIKVSILVFYLRFSSDVYFRVCTYFVIFVVVGYSLTNFLGTLIINCNDKLQANCRIIVTIYIVGAILNVATDIAILLLPFWILRPMKVSPERKVGVALILMAGGFVSAVSIIRLIITIRVQGEPDVTYEWAESVKWSLIESWSGIICACLPCIKPFLHRQFPSFPLWSFIEEGSSGSRRRLRTISS